ncbi:MAG: hypothetical protein AB7O97_15675 [Planctomycetota bacterium]
MLPIHVPTPVPPEQRGVALAFWAILAISFAIAWRYCHVTLDDTFLYLRTVDMALAGHGPRFNPGDGHMPLTGPGWLLLLWGGKALLPFVSLPVLAKAMALAALAAASWCLRGLLRPFPVAAALAPIACFFAPNAMLMCGHDTALALATGLWLLLCHRRGADRWLWLAAAAFYLARSEGAVFGLLVLAHAMLRRGSTVGAWRAALRDMAPGLAAGAALVVGWHLYFALEFGSLLPSTMQAKLLQGRAGWTVYGEKLGDHLLVAAGGWWLLPLALVGAVALCRRVPQLFWWVAVHSAFFAGLRIAYYHWYFYPVDAVALACLLVGLDLVARRLWTAPRSRVPARAGAVVGVAAALATLAPLRHALLDPPPHDARYEHYRGYAELMRAGADRRAAAGDPLRILSHEIGVLGYLLPQAVFADTSGLATPVERAEELNDWALQVERNQPDVVMGPYRWIRGELLYETTAGRRLYREVAAGGGARLFVDPDLLPAIWEAVDPRLRRLLAFAGPATAPDRARFGKPPEFGLAVMAPPGAVPLASDPDTDALTVAFGLTAESPDGAGLCFYAVVGDGPGARRLWQRELRRGAAGDGGSQVGRFAVPGAGRLRLGTEPIPGVPVATGCWLDVKQR